MSGTPARSAGAARRAPRIVLLAGEASGDLHGAALARALIARWPSARLSGTGGPAMRAEGVELLAGLEELAVMGFAEVVPRLPFFIRLRKRVLDLLERTRADLVIPIDYPGFNLRIARAAHARGHKVLYYIAPQVWAWRSGRARRLAEVADRVAVILPFEADFLAGFGVRATYVGHPLLDRPGDVADRSAFCARWGLDSGRTLLAILPGSRAQELRRHLTRFVEIARLVTEARPDVLPVLSRASTLHAGPFHDSGLPVVGDTRALLRHATAALVKSGTATLEAALESTPHVIAYVTSPLTAALARRVVRTPHIGLPNLVAGAPIVPELFQEAVDPPLVARTLVELLDVESPARARQVAELERVRSALGEPGAAERVAALAAELLEEA